ncbi:hypothetical protein ACIBK8_29900 [Streptomyces sp. NPDC050161]|uniref:hypothetical protein n=1 Tax=Streptomyces sp. NPDC050161 TaxID=3365604 RepID=UPI0037B963D5
MQQDGLTVATVITLGSGFVLVTVGARIMLGERTGAAGTAAAGRDVAGLVLLMGGADGSIGPALLLGIGYALLSAADYAGVPLLGRVAGHQSSGGAFEATLIGFAVGTVCLLPKAAPVHAAVAEPLLGKSRRHPKYLCVVPSWHPATETPQKPAWRTRATPATFLEAVREIEEVVPVNAVSTWVLPSGVTVGR